uniref:Uncharacterized protein n=1 Tax=Daphnia galeata TaxID=27404 RepID=A0A8J2RV42_9CRUS|nr:unnamed protein product [Daphnia galeata]
METPLDVLSRAATLIHDQLHKTANIKHKENDREDEIMVRCVGSNVVGNHLLNQSRGLRMTDEKKKTLQQLTVGLVSASTKSCVFHGANGRPMASQPSQQRVPPPHDPPPNAAAVRPKPLWQPWSDSDDDRDFTSNRVGADHDGGGSKELPTRTKKERRRHERHHELLSTAARARKERIPVETADEVDRPLDMSTGRRASPPPYPAAGSSTGILPSYPMRYPSPPDYGSSSGPRPSVITCASSLRSSPAPSCPSPCGSTSSSASQSRTTTGNGSSSPPPLQVRSLVRPAADGEARLPPQRREIISSVQEEEEAKEEVWMKTKLKTELNQALQAMKVALLFGLFVEEEEEEEKRMCDPVIDEHFRRSLGERYTHLFASSSPSSSSSSTSNLTTANDSSSRDGAAANKMPSTVNVTGLSVDDHFAKALGETWLKLQKTFSLTSRYDIVMAFSSSEEYNKLSKRKSPQWMQCLCEDRLIQKLVPGHRHY